MAAGKSSAVLVQYVALRKDLPTVHKWPLGALIAQACHACTAVMHASREDPLSEQYLAELDHMHKVVVEVSHGWVCDWLLGCGLVVISPRIMD